MYRPQIATIPINHSGHPTKVQNETGYLPCLDGLRGVSILTIVLVHALLPDIRANGFGAAFIGVNTFFVLSGFLITSLLLTEWDEYGAISLRRFYARRSLRLLPALALVLVTLVAWSFMRSTAFGFASLRDSLFPAFYVSNWARALGFDRPVLFAHTWSLSIEEQFYLLWPLTLLFLLKRTTSRASLIRYLLVTLFVFVTLRILLVAGGASANRVFNGTDTRADSLLVGCLVAMLLGSGLYQPIPWLKSLVGFGAWIAVLLLARLSFRHDFNRPFAENVLFSLCSLGAGLVILEIVTHESGLLSRLFSQRWLVYSGKVSYGLYLWHAAIFQQIFGRGWSRPQELLIAFLLTATCTLGSYYLVECPCLEFKRRFARARTVYARPAFLSVATSLQSES